jgi:hypothetical protein
VLPIPLQNKFTTIFHFDGKDKNIHLNVSTQYVEPYCFGGVVVSVLATGPKGRGFAKAIDFKGDKNPQQTFLPMGSKAADPMS